jgi:NAD(P)H-quinone oxidoreductase subunit 4L
MVPVNYYLAGAAALYIVGIYCLVMKRNMIRLLMALEIMLNGVNLNFIAFASYGVPGFTDPLAHAFVIVSIGIGGCIVALGLAITLHAYRHYDTLDVRELRRLRR